MVVHHVRAEGDGDRDIGTADGTQTPQDLALADLDPAAARAGLVEQWLRQFGPGTTTDIKWWTGWTVRNTQAALAMLDVAEVDLELGNCLLHLGEEATAKDLIERAAAVIQSSDAADPSQVARARQVKERQKVGEPG